MDDTARFPAEILCLIFYFASLINPVPVDHPRYDAETVDIEPLKLQQYRRTYVLAWISLTHVCSRWRVLALDYAVLWTHVPVVLGEQWVETFLTRSQQQPIDVHWESRYFHPAEAGPDASIITHRTRIRTLNLGIIIVSNSAMREAFCLPWPALEEFTGDVRNIIGSLPFLGDNAPRLRRLRINLKHRSNSMSMSIPVWNSSILNGLVELDLALREGIDPGSMCNVVEALARMSQLRHLNLSCCAYNHDRAHEICLVCFPVLRRVFVPLKMLHLSLQSPSIAHFMHHVHMPSDTRLRLRFDYGVGEEEEIAFSQVMAQIAGWNQLIPLSIVALMSDFPDFHVYLSRAPKHTDRQGSCGQGTEWAHQPINVVDPLPDWSIMLMLMTFEAVNLRWVQILCALAPDSIRVLYLDIKDPSGAPALSLSHNVFANIITLRMKQPILSILWDMADEDEDGVFRIFPALETLDFEEISLLYLFEVQRNAGTVSDALLHMLERRRERHPLREVYLRVAMEVAQVREGMDVWDLPLPEALVLDGIAALEAAREIRMIDF